MKITNPCDGAPGVLPAKQGTDIFCSASDLLFFYPLNVFDREKYNLMLGVQNRILQRNR